MSARALFDEPKVDAHCHVLDPGRFAYASDVAYRPAGQEIGTLKQYQAVMDAYGIQHALLVGPNSGYGLDNRCLLDALAQGAGRLRGVAVVPNNSPLQTLKDLQRAGVVGVAFNAALLGTAFYADTAPLLRRLADLDLFVQLQVQHDQLLDLLPLLKPSGTRVVVDHAGRPHAARGLDQPGFKALLQMADWGRVTVKLSGLQKFSQTAFPHEDAFGFVHRLIDSFGPDACVWASDWPFLRAPERVDMGPLMQQMAALCPSPETRRKIWWDTPRRVFGFASLG